MFRLQIIFLALLALPGVAMAQFETDHPGYFPIENLGILPEGKINLEINLPGAILKFVALAMGEEDPDLARIAENLQSIRVRGADLEGSSTESIRSAFQNASEMLKAAGWVSMVRVREDDEEVYIFFKEQEGQMVGLTVLTLEDKEAMLINLVGKIDPRDLSGLAEGLDLDLPDINSVSGSSATDN